jgi:hypothetical protein
VNRLSYYLTHEDFITAKKNGINYAIAYSRYYQYGWPKEKAITQPVRRRTWKWKDFEKACKELDISQYMFYKRVRMGMTPEQASTLPVNRKKPGTKIDAEVVKIAAQNGITEGTLKSRVYLYKWTVERAMTEPVDERFRRKP